MGYDVAIWGKLKLAPGKMDEWKKLVVDGSAWNDWQMWFQPHGRAEPRAVAAHLSAFAKLGDASGPRFFEVEEDDAGVTVRAFLSDTDFVASAHDIAATFRSAARVGATGKLTFAGVGTALGFEVALAKGGKSKLAEVNEDLEDSAPVLRILTRARNREIKGLAAAPAPALAEVTGKEPITTGLPPDVAASIKEVHARLEAADPAALVAASKQGPLAIQVQGKPARVDEMFKTRDAILVGLRGLSGKTADGDLESLHEAALKLYRRLDPAAAEPVLVGVLRSSAPRLLRASAAFALTGTRSDDAVEALFAALNDPGYEQGGAYYNPVRRGAEDALGKTGRADVADRALSLLTPKALEIPQSRGNVKPIPEARAKEDFARAPLKILAALAHRPALKRLVAIFRKHPVVQVRGLAGEAILASATPEELRSAFGTDKPQTWPIIPVAEKLVDDLEARKAI